MGRKNCRARKNVTVYSPKIGVRTINIKCEKQKDHQGPHKIRVGQSIRIWVDEEK